MLFKNLKIGKKLIASFVVVSLLASIAGAVCAVVMKGVDSEYSNALEQHGFAQGDIGKLMSAFCRIDGNVHDSVSYIDVDSRGAAIANVDSQSASMDGYFEAVKKGIVIQENWNYYNAAKEGWESYIKIAKELVQSAASTSPLDMQATVALQKKLTEELDPQYMLVYDNMKNLMDAKVAAGSHASTDLTRSTNQSVMLSIGIIIAAMVVSITLGVIISRSISKPVAACADRLEKLAKGDLQSPVPVIDSRDETGILANATEIITAGLFNVVKDVSYLLEEMSEGNFDVRSKAVDNYIGDFLPMLKAIRAINSKLSDTLAQINESSEQVSSGSDQVSSGAQALSQGATEQASAIEELAAAISEISTQVNENADNAVSASKKAASVGDQIMSGNKNMQHMTTAMKDISDKSAQIGKIIKTIEDIAFQTNILALNAAVEAARAGEAGKGFAVVADEVRSLASKSADASKDTALLIQGSIEAVENGTKIADLTASQLLEVVQGAKEIVATIDSIAAASKAQSDSITQVTLGVDQISSVVQTNSATAEESAAASEELSGQAQMLKELVSKFTLKSGESTHKAASVPDVQTFPSTEAGSFSSAKY
ncbi:methyl-accepting chemotaxis protein [Hungatella hathewayi]|uniref:methyl-accepting chemotaxis protein n=1 Tax=Hungatella hathewayi TaxID=154046 RepID=UPI00356434B6